MNAPANISFEAALKARYAAAKARTFPGRTATRQKPEPAPVVISVASKPIQKREEVQQRAHVDAYHAWLAWTGAPMTPKQFFIAACFLAGHPPELIKIYKGRNTLAPVRKAIIRSIAQRFPKMTSPRIGEIVNRDHSTVLYCMGQTARSQKRATTKIRKSPAPPMSMETRDEVIRMRLEGIPFPEIAAKLNVGISPCWNLMHRYRQALRAGKDNASEALERVAA